MSAFTFSIASATDSDDMTASLYAQCAPPPVDIVPHAPQYTLPLNLSTLTNAAHQDVQRIVRDQHLAALLARHGCAVWDDRWGHDGTESIVAFYDNLRRFGIPVFITSDALLHLYHVLFSNILTNIEARVLFHDTLALSQAMYTACLERALEADGEAGEALRKATMYFAVPWQILAMSSERLTQLTLWSQVEALRHAVADWTAWTPLDKSTWWWQKPWWEQGPERQEQARALQEQELRPWTQESRRRDEILGQYCNAVYAVTGKSSVGSETMDAPEALRRRIDTYLATHPRPDVVEGGLPEWALSTVASELTLIYEHQGFATSPLFFYEEDYSQYIPRGHYTHTPTLERYFRVLMWYGRMVFLLNGGDKAEGKALVSTHEARIQTMAASAITALLSMVQLDDGRSAAAVWERLCTVTAYCVGRADDLTPSEYRPILHQVLGEHFTLHDFEDADTYAALCATLVNLRQPTIYSGTGNIIHRPSVARAPEAGLGRALGQTQGLRLVGQRTTPDAYILGRLVYPTVGQWHGDNVAFTTVVTPFGSIRGFPRGLDVMAVFGSQRARALLTELQDDRYVQYEHTLATLQQQDAARSVAEWHESLYGGWLYCLKALLDVPGPGYPTFMQTTAWLDKQLNTALGSWTQLRHDTMLYAKQSYTIVFGLGATAWEVPKPQMVEGYVEPVPEFYTRLLRLTRMTRQGLSALGVLDAQTITQLQAVETIVARLGQIAQQELQGTTLAEDDYAFIRNFADQLTQAIAGIVPLDSETLKTTLVADVHTDSNSEQVLEEATGSLRTLGVVYPMPDGGMVFGAGPVFSYYEFKQPMAERLTDTTWRDRLRDWHARPALPGWISSYVVSNKEVPGPALTVDETYERHIHEDRSKRGAQSSTP